MSEFDFHSAPANPRPRTVTVLGLLAAAAAVFSYLGAYALSDALVSAEMLKPWPADHDPRPRWFITGLMLLLGSFTLIGVAARFFSQRHLRQIDEMDDP